MQVLLTSIVFSTCMLLVKCYYDRHHQISDNQKKQQFGRSLSERSVREGIKISYETREGREFPRNIVDVYSVTDSHLLYTKSVKFPFGHISSLLKGYKQGRQPILNIKKTETEPYISFEIKNDIAPYINIHDKDTVEHSTPVFDIIIRVTPNSLPLSQLIKNAPQGYRGLMDGANTLIPPTISPMLSYMLILALTLAGLLPWILPGIRLAAGFVQMINQVAFMAGLGALVRNYVFDAKPDEHIVYINQGYDIQGHTKHHHSIH